MHKFYKAAKGAKCNQEQCRHFSLHVQQVERMLGKANQSSLADDLASSIQSVKDVVSQALQFVEKLQGKGFLRRMMSSKDDDLKLEKLTLNRLYGVENIVEFAVPILTHTSNCYIKLVPDLYQLLVPLLD